MRTGVFHVGVTIGSRILGVLITIVIQCTLARLLLAEGRGGLAACNTFAFLLGVVITLGADVGIQYFLASGKIGVSQAVALTFSLCFGGSVVAVGVGLAIMDVPLGIFDRAASSSFALAICLIPLGATRLGLQRMLVGLRDYTCLAAVKIGALVARLVLIVAYVWGFSGGINGAIVADATTNIVVTVVLLILFRRRHGCKLVMPSSRAAGKVLHYGLRYYVGKLSNQFNLRIGTLLLAFLVSAEDLGVYVVAFALVAYVIVLSDSVSVVLMPRIASDGRSGRPDLTALCVRWNTAVAFAVLVPMVVFAEPIIRLLLSSEFLGAVWPMRIIAIGVFMRCSCQAFDTFMIGTNRPGYASAAVLAGLAVNVGLLLVLYPRGHLAGAAAAAAANYTISSSILLAGFVHYAGMSPFRIWRYRRSDLSPLFPGRSPGT